LVPRRTSEGFGNFPIRLIPFRGRQRDLYLNGKKLTYHEGWNDPFTVSLGNAWNADGPNVLAVLVYNGAGAGGIGETHFKSGDQDVSIKVWRWRGVPEPDMKDLDMSGLKEDPSGTAWKDAVADQDVFSNSKGFAWFRADLPEIAVEGRVLQFDAVDDIATIYLNGTVQQTAAANALPTKPMAINIAIMVNLFMDILNGS